MFKQFRDRVSLSGIAVLLTGVALLVFTFVSAYGFLTQSLSIIASQDLVQTFGNALAPLIATCIRIMYLGIMGWIGSLLTIRGISIITRLSETQAAAAQKSEATQRQPPQKAKAEKPTKEKAEIEVKPSEPEFVVIPPEETTETPSIATPPEKKESQPTS
jgi:hypothetical protein